MFKLIKRRRAARYERKVAGLARQALALAAESYRSGKFKWTVYKEFTDGDKFTSACLTRDEDAGSTRYRRTTSASGRGGETVELQAHEVMQYATGGCALGGISKAAWQVTGSPHVEDEGWQLKIDVEIEAEGLLLAQLGYAGSNIGHIASFNDDQSSSERVAAELEFAAIKTA